MGPDKREYRGVVPHLIARDAAAAIDFYVEAFGAEVLARSEGPDGRVWHSELQIRDGKILVCDEFPEFGMVAPTTLGVKASAVALSLEVDDIQSAVERAERAGGEVPKGIKNKHWGDLYCGLWDPFGHRWELFQQQETKTQEELEEKQEDFFRRHPEYSRENVAQRTDEWHAEHPELERPNVPPARSEPVRSGR
jgi:PhnB protein